MPTNGAPTKAESLATVEQASTMLSCWLVLMQAATGKSRTHGVLVGENLDTSDLPKVILVEFAEMLVLCPNDCDNQILIKKI